MLKGVHRPGSFDAPRSKRAWHIIEHGHEMALHNAQADNVSADLPGLRSRLRLVGFVREVTTRGVAAQLIAKKRSLSSFPRMKKAVHLLKVTYIDCQISLGRLQGSMSEEFSYVHYIQFVS